MEINPGKNIGNNSGKHREINPGKKGNKSGKNRKQIGKKKENKSGKKKPGKNKEINREKIGK